MLRYVCISAFLVAPTLATLAQAAPDDHAVAAAIEAYARPLAARGELSGQLLVLRRGRVVAERSFGAANLELGVEVNPQTRFNCASVTKPMTAVIALQLLDEGRIGLQDPIARWLPDFPNGDSIRIQMLLGHRSGIPHTIVPDSEMVRPFTAAEVAARAAGLALDFTPGSQTRYSSGGYEVLARVLELVSGRSFAELAEERIFRPLGMTNTLHGDSRTLMPDRATGYVPGPHGLENAPLQDFSALVGAGSVWTTARDLHRFVDAIVTGKLGSNVTKSFVRGGRLSFNGRVGGFKAWALSDSLSGIEAIFLGNVASGAPDALKGDILDLASGKAVAPPEPPALRSDAVPLDELRRWEGVYQIEHGPRVELRVRDGTLYSNDWVMLPTRDGAMYSPRDYGLVRAITEPDRTISRLDWGQRDRTYPAPRVAD